MTFVKIDDIEGYNVDIIIVSMDYSINTLRAPRYALVNHLFRRDLNYPK